MNLLKLENINHHFQGYETNLHVLKNVNFALARRQVVALVGPSGSGKSTLLQIMGLLEKPTSGTVILNQCGVSSQSDEEISKIRGKNIGFVYQYHHLLPEFTALENIVLAQMINATPQTQAVQRAEHLLKLFNVDHRKNHFPKLLSGGEQQRVAIARALSNQPDLILADEPTGNLDNETSAIVFSELVRVVKQQNVGAIIATHDLDLAKQMDRVIRLKNGSVEEISL